MTIQCRCYTWHGVIECHDIGSTVSLLRQTLTLTNIDNLSPTSVDGSRGYCVCMFEYTLLGKGNFQKYWVCRRSSKSTPKTPCFSLGPIFGAPNNFFIPWLLELRFRSSQAYMTYLCEPLYSLLTYCDNPAPVWHLPWHNMMPWFLTYGAVTAPKSQTVYSDFPRFLITV